MGFDAIDGAALRTLSRNRSAKTLGAARAASAIDCVARSPPGDRSRCVGVEAQVFERSPRLDRVGGGIVVQPDFAEYLESFGYARPETTAVPTSNRKILSQDGSIARVLHDSTFHTGWDTVLNALKRSVPAHVLHAGKGLRSFVQTQAGVACLFSDGATDTFDRLVAADGVGSGIRQQLLPDVSASYAGYVGYRGLIPERATPHEVHERIDESLVFYSYPHSHILAYFIPGPDGSTARGERRLNWVWYLSQSSEQLAGVLADRAGHSHHASLPPGAMADTAAALLRRRA